MGVLFWGAFRFFWGIIGGVFQYFGPFWSALFFCFGVGYFFEGEWSHVQMSVYDNFLKRV